MKPLISFVIPVYNREKTVSATVKSIMDSPFQNFEIILVDDASSDHSAEVCKQLKDNSEKIIFFQNEHNSGEGMTRNRGIELSSGKYLEFCDSDDRINGEILPKIARILSDNPDVEILTANYMEITHESSEVVRVIKNEKKCTADSLLAENPHIIHFGMWTSFFSREFVLSNGLQFGRMYTNADVCFNSAAFLSANVVYTIPDVFYLYYLGFAENSVLVNAKLQQISGGASECLRSLLPYYEDTSLSLAKRHALDILSYAMTASLLLKMTPEQLKNIDLTALENKENILSIDYRLFMQVGLMNCTAYMWQNLLRLSKEAIKENKSVYICPAGANTVKLAQKLLDSGMKLTGVLDNSCTEDNSCVRDAKQRLSLDVYGFDYLANRSGSYFVIILTSYNTTYAIAKQLEGMGNRKPEQYVHFFPEQI